MSVVLYDLQQVKDDLSHIEVGRVIVYFRFQKFWPKNVVGARNLVLLNLAILVSSFIIF